MKNNILEFKSKDEALIYATKLAEESKDVTNTVIDLLSNKCDSSLKDIFVFNLKVSNVVNDLIDILGETSSFEDFDKDTKEHFAMQIENFFVRIEESISEARKQNNKNLASK